MLSKKQNQLNRRAEKQARNIIKLTKKLNIKPEALFRMIGCFGTTGVGKSVLVRHLLKEIIENFDNFKITIYDPKAEFFQEFYDEMRDYVLSLRDNRTNGMGFLKYLHESEEYESDVIDNLVSIIIKIHDGLDEERKGWLMSCRKVLKAIFLYCYENDITSDAELRRMALLPFTELGELFQGVEGAEIATNFLCLDEAKQRTINQGIFSGSINFLVNYNLIGEQLDNGDISFLDFYAREKSGIIWILGEESQEQEILKENVATAIEMCANTVYGIGQKPKSSNFFIVDEFSELNAMPKLQSLLTKGRSYNCSVIILMQSISQLKQNWGDNNAETILSLLNTLIIFKSTGDLNTETLSKIIGDQKISEWTAGSSNGMTMNRVGASSTQAKKFERAVIPHEITKLGMGEVYYRPLSGDWAKINMLYDPDDQPVIRHEAHMYRKKKKTVKKPVERTIEDIPDSPKQTLQKELWSEQEKTPEEVQAMKEKIWGGN